MSLAVDEPILNNPFEEPRGILGLLRRPEKIITRERKYGFKIS